jgi:hypothetical protein
MHQVFDINQTPINVGDTVFVHFTTDSEIGIVVEITDSQTVNHPGYYVDVNINNQGPTGIPSYMIEVFKLKNFKGKMKGKS